MDRAPNGWLGANGPAKKPKITTPTAAAAKILNLIGQDNSIGSFQSATEVSRCP
jgi:hypothetical protein